MATLMMASGPRGETGASTWLAAIVYSLLILEGAFKIVIETQFTYGTAFWSALFPVNLFPSEVSFILIGLPLSLLMVPRAFMCREKSLWILLSGVLMVYSGIQMLHGIRNGAGNNAYIYFKAFGFKLLWVPLFVAVAMSANIDRMLELVWKFTCLFSFYVIFYGLAMIAQGNITTKDPYSANFTGSQLMTLPMVYGFLKYVTTRKPTWIMGSGCILISTIVTLEKPAITTSLVAIFLTWGALSIVGTNGRRLNSDKLGSYIVTVFMVLLCGAMAYFILNKYSDGEWLNYLESRFFKVGLKEDDVSSGRFFMWEWALDMWIKSPLVGHGIGVLYPGLDSFVGVHNIPLELLYTTGLIGFFLYYFWALSPIYAGWRSFGFVTPRSGEGIVAITVWLVVIHIANLFGNTTTVQTMSFAYVGATVFLAVATAKQTPDS